MKTSLNPNLKYRPDIDGLRTVAVMPVVMFHAGILPLARGGFIGVDVFFVISGFLITKIIHTEIFEKQNFSVKNFYYRRAKRIIPAAIPVYIFCVLLSLFLYFPDEQRVVYRSTLSSLSFFSNLYFFLTSNYFDSSSTMNPILHTWSLSVEEQFYFVLPPIMLLISRFCGASKRRSEVIVLSSIAVASFVAACVFLARYPEAVFYLLPFRAWELLLGSLIGIGAIPLHRWKVGAECTALAGILLIGGSVLFLHSGMPFPGLSALPAVAGSAMIIHAGLSHPGTASARVLGLWPVRFIGMCSYSIYLWHWPIVVFFPFVLGEPTMLSKLGLVMVSVIAGIVSWAVIERPLRHGPLLSTPGLTFTRVGIGMAVTAAIAFLAPNVSRIVNPLPLAAANYLAQADSPGKGWRSGTCFLTEASNNAIFDLDVCLKESSTKRNVMLVGDSHAAQYYPALSKIADIQLLQATASGCRPVDDRSNSARCKRVMDAAFARLAHKSRIETVILAGRWQPSDASSIEKRVNSLTAKGYHVIVMGPVPEYAQPLPRLMALKVKNPDMHLRDFLRRTPLQAEQNISRSITRTNATYISTIDIVCPKECISTLDNGRLMQFDYGHLTTDGSDFVIGHVPKLIASR